MTYFDQPHPPELPVTAWLNAAPDWQLYGGLFVALAFAGWWGTQWSPTMGAFGLIAVLALGVAVGILSVPTGAAAVIAVVALTVYSYRAAGY